MGEDSPADLSERKKEALSGKGKAKTKKKRRGGPRKEAVYNLGADGAARRLTKQGEERDCGKKRVPQKR